MSKIGLFTLATLLIISHAFSQGCSDAGFCTMGAMRPDQSYTKKLDLKLRYFDLSYYRGSTTLSPIIQSITADMNFSISEKMSFQLKIPYQTVQGHLGSNHGLADLSWSVSRSMTKVGSYNLGLTVGGKIPTGHANDNGDKEGFGTGDNPPGPLPMYYQVSLGTYDVVAGASLLNDKWMFATGIQVPVIHQNENNFRWGRWGDFPNQDYIEKYFLANNLKRGIDVMIRAERNFRFLNYNFSVGLLPIYRITKDETYNFTTDEREKLDGTTGLAMSALISAGYRLNVYNSLKLIYGQKLTDRKVNPDGLTRHNVLSLNYTYKF